MRFFSLKKVKNCEIRSAVRRLVKKGMKKSKLEGFNFCSILNYFYQFFGYFLEHVPNLIRRNNEIISFAKMVYLELSIYFYDHFENHVCEKCQFFEIFWKIFGNFLGNLRQIVGKFLGNLRQIFGKFETNFWEI